MSFLNSQDVPTETLVDWPTLRFVLQRHDTTQIHWDLRIDANGILYTWRMYQLPSVNPLRVVSVCLEGQDNSKDMLGEGVISEASPTQVEEFGWVMPLGVSSQSQAQDFQAQFRAGRIELWIEGSRLRGGFVLEGRGERWRIRKLADEFATTVEPEWTSTSAPNGPRAW
jgi:hypothetical protein